MAASFRWIGLVVALGTVAASASATTFSVSGDWSNTMNPNGPWSYNQGSTPLPLVPDWNAGYTAFVGCNQPAWAPSNNTGNFLPALMKANSCTANSFGIPGNVKPGDIVMHTVDPYNGNPGLGVGNFLFTLPSGDGGKYEISGMVWDAGQAYGTARPQDWELLVNGVQEASGFLSGIVPRTGAQTFNVFANLAPGETVDLELYEAPGAAAGFFVGTNMTIAGSSGPTVPEPSTFGTVAFGFLLSAAALRNWVRLK